MTERQEFFDKYSACKEGQEWVARKCPGDDLASLYDYLSKSKEQLGKDYFAWLWPKSFDDKTLRLLAWAAQKKRILEPGNPFLKITV